jgi:periplasmic mercuric ion binding protein
MKTSLTTLLSVVAFAVAARAESSVTLTGVHNCCKSCTTGIAKAVGTVKGASATCDKGTVTVTAKTATDAKKAVAALLDAGYYGEGAKAQTASDGKVKSVTVTGVHLCCGKCVTAFNEAATAGGATKTDAVKGAASVTIEGDVSPSQILTALNKGGFNGKVK